MKRIFTGILAILIFLIALNTPALAETNDLVMIIRPDGAVMYDSIDRKTARPIAIIPDGEIALLISVIDWGYCVTFGNYAGYIYESDGVVVNSSYYDYELPSGVDYSYPGQNSVSHSENVGIASCDTDYIPEFLYKPIKCRAVDRLAARSGPGTYYTWHEFHSGSGGVKVLYQYENEGVYWGCMEFEYDAEKYRIYTGMKRISVSESVPVDPEDYVYATITAGHLPRLGPGYDYAAALESVPADVSVRAFFQEDGWLMYEYTLDHDEIQRAWAPPGYWE